MELLPFNSVTTCPACGGSTKGFSVEYSTAPKFDAGNGRFVAAPTFGTVAPHLEKHCPHCGFGWLEHTKERQPVTTSTGRARLDAVGAAGCKATTEHQS